MFGRKKTAAESVASRVVDTEQDDVRQDDLGPYPERINDSPSQTTALGRALRSVTLVAIISGLANIAMLMLIITLLPLKQVQPYLVTFKDQDNQVVSIDPVSVDAPGIRFMAESDVRDYVIQRHRFVPIRATMEEIRGPNSRLAARTSTPAYEAFQRSSQIEMSRLMEGGYTRTVEIEGVTQINQDTWQVNFKTIDTLPTSGGTLALDQTITTGATTPTGAPVAGVGGTGAIPGAAGINTQSVQSWTATLRFDYQPQTVTYDKRLLNPLGFTVLEYSVVARR